MESTPVSPSSDRLVLGMPLNGVNTLIACLHLPQEDLEYIYDKLSRRTQAGKDRTAQLAAAEARATEAAAEAGKWQQRHGELQQELAEQERDKLRLVQETHRWSEAEKRDKVRHQEEVDELKHLLRLSESYREAYRSAKLSLYEVAAGNNFMLDALMQHMPCSEGGLERASTRVLGGRVKPADMLAPVAPQQQEGGGQ